MGVGELSDRDDLARGVFHLVEELVDRNRQCGQTSTDFLDVLFAQHEVAEFCVEVHQFLGVARLGNLLVQILDDSDARLHHHVGIGAEVFAEGRSHLVE